MQQIWKRICLWSVETQLHLKLLQKKISGQSNANTPRGRKKSHQAEPVCTAWAHPCVPSNDDRDPEVHTKLGTQSTPSWRYTGSQSNHKRLWLACQASFPLLGALAYQRGDWTQYPPDDKWFLGGKSQPESKHGGECGSSPLLHTNDW